MIYIQIDVYSLPDIDCVGGEHQRLMFYLKTRKGHPFNLDMGQAEFSIINYSNKIGVPVLSKTGSIGEDTEGVMSVVTVYIDPKETVMLYGMYVYQLILTDRYGIIEIPRQGKLFIGKNIHRQYIL